MAERDDQGRRGENANAPAQASGPELQELAVNIIRRAHPDLPRGVGLCVFVFNTNSGPGHTAYASSALRDSTLQMLRDFLVEADEAAKADG